MTLEKRHQFINRLMALVAFCFAISTLVAGLQLKLSGGDVSALSKITVVGGWAVGPPFWLWFEWFFLLKPTIPLASNPAIQLETIKHEQSIVRALWAGFLAVTVVLYDVVPTLP